MVSMLNRNLGLAIDEYVLVNWYSVAVCINQMGGVTLNIPDQTFLTYFNSYLDFTNRATGIWAPELYAPGTYLMTGTQAVAYCRIRSMGINDQSSASLLKTRKPTPSRATSIRCSRPARPRCRTCVPI